ncbi:phytanoyl-dioxygenase family protein [Diplodia corticola]|uniref:Phytanoyl-dioxygenase family protein n=1 Tax=Diplodia corticola TaxID=236234 RepID=A0A1J9RJ84_9PEZI|nr:phytanoyl-dioxygenase family protein [Diplodia corticola]OJD40720.1 phytanoyl-dioxygenase family protein [Diplodia corticola]
MPRSAVATSIRYRPSLKPAYPSLCSNFRFKPLARPIMASFHTTPAAATNGSAKRSIQPRAWSLDESISVKDFAGLCEQTATTDDYPLAAAVEKNIPVYDLASFSLDDQAAIDRLQDEWNHVLLSGPGVFAVKNLYTDHSAINAANKAYDDIIAAEASGAKGDHFAASSANSRIWNSFSKHGLADPSSFVAYYSNPWLSHICAAWLGPAYRITAQLNIVRPGGAPQVSHRDYHLGFQTADACARFPKAMQVASQLLTLQGAVAHSDMPLSSGPTRFLPFSQQFPQGYMAYRRPEFNEYFLSRWVSLPLSKGDGVFFNPALFHAAGANESSDIDRSANLVQISSAFGKPMETVDALPLVERCWEDIKALKKQGDAKAREVRALIAAVGEGYPFPTNLDKRPPAPGGMAPESEQELLLRGLDEGWSTEEVVANLKQMREDSKA